MDPLVSLVMDQSAMKVASTLIAKLEHVRYDETRRGVFRTPWAANLFVSCMERINVPKFDIEAWYQDVVSRNKPRSVDYRISPALYAQCLDTNWLHPLLETELKHRGFMVILHNILDLEDTSHTKLAAQAKSEVEYDFLGLGQRNQVMFALPSSSQKQPMLLKR